MNKKLLLIQPSPYGLNHKPIKKKRLHFVGLALPLLAALTPDDWDVELCLETIEDIPIDTDADLVGISTMGHGMIRSVDLAHQFRAAGKRVIMGGYMASLVPEEARKHCDAVVVGDAEPVWKQLLADAERNALKPFYHQSLIQLNPPVPRYELLTDKRIGNYLPVQAGRGCPNSCSFCSIHCLYRGRYYSRPIKDVTRDIARVKELGFRRFILLDDNICADPEHMKSLCREIAGFGMTWMSQCSITIGDNPELLQALAVSGCTALSFGLESISRQSLEDLDKAWAVPEEYPRLIRAVRKEGIDVSTEMVVGADGDTLESIRQTAGFIERTRIVLPRFYILTPIPGTDLFSQMKLDGRLVNHNIYSYNGAEAVHRPQNMTAPELTKAYWSLYDRVYSMRSILRRTVFSPSAWRRPGRLLFYLLANVCYRHHIRRRIAPNIF